MENTVKLKEKTRGVPQKGTFASLAALIMAAGGGFALLVGIIGRTTAALGTALFTAVLAAPTMASALFLTLSGVSLTLDMKADRASQTPLWLLLASGVSMSASYIGSRDLLLVSLAALLLLISFKGSRFNMKITVPFINRTIPLFSLAAALLFLLTLIATYGDYGFAGIVVLLSRAGFFAGATMLALSMEARTVKDYTIPYRTRAVAGDKGVLYIAGAVLLFIAMGYDAAYLSPLTLIITMLTGIIMLVPALRRSLYSLAGLFIFWSYYSGVIGTGVYRWSFVLLYLLPAALTLMSVVGTVWNSGGEGENKRPPLLSLAAAVLFGLGAIWSLISLFTADNYVFRPMVILYTVAEPLAYLIFNLASAAQQTNDRPFAINWRAMWEGLMRLVNPFYKDVGNGLQVLAKILGGICVLCGCLCLIALVLCGAAFIIMSIVGGDQYTRAMLGSLLPTLLIATPSCFLMVLSTWPLYAYGQLVSDVRHIKNSGLSAPAPSARSDANPDDLPEL